MLEARIVKLKATRSTIDVVADMVTSQGIARSAQARTQRGAHHKAVFLS